MRTLTRTCLIIIASLVGGPGHASVEDSEKTPEPTLVMPTKSEAAAEEIDATAIKPTPQSWAASQPHTDVPDRDARTPKTVPQE